MYVAVLVEGHWKVIQKPLKSYKKWKTNTCNYNTYRLLDFIHVHDKVSNQKKYSQCHNTINFSIYCLLLMLVEGTLVIV